MSKSVLSIAVLTAAGLLAACQPAAEHGSDAVAVEMVEAPPGGAPAMSPAAPAAAADQAASPSTAAPIQAVSQIAYRYDYRLELPVDRIAPTLKKHEAACVAAGPMTCQLLGSNTQAMGDDQMVSSLSLRATPAWLARFRAGLDGEAEAAGGKVAAATTTSEDLTRSLIDTEARLTALSTLRDRLQQLLATRSAPLAQLLETERELARVQGELDATRSALNAMRARVTMSEMSIEYRSQAIFASEGAFAPLSNALKASLSVFMGSLAFIVYALAALLPIALIATPLVLWIRKRRATERARKAAAKVEATPTPE